MDTTTSIFSKMKAVIVGTLVFLFPLFFLPTTQEFFATNKLYLLAFGGLLLLLVSLIEFLVTKELSVRKRIFDNALLLMLVAIGLSTVITATNKVQALLSPEYGLMMFFFLAILYFYASRKRLNFVPSVLYASSLIVSLLTILFFFNPLKNVGLPANFDFLKSQYFTPLGNQIDLAIFLGFIVSMVIAHLIILLRTKSDEREFPSPLVRTFYMVTLAVSSVAFLLTLYSLYELSKAGALILPPLRLSWYAAIEILKNPLTAVFGIGIDNFPVIFTQVKDFAYNQSSLWQTSYFDVARSSVLHILSESGILGLTAFVLLLVLAVRHIDLKKGRRLNPLLLPGLFLLAVLLLLSPSLIVFFLLMIFFTLFTPDTDEEKPSEFDVASLIPLYLSVAVVGVVFIGIVLYLVGRSYLAEHTFKRSIDAVANNNARDLYVHQQNALILNPYIERFHINFAQTNLLLANNIAQRALQAQTATASAGQAAPTINEEERQIIGQAIQAAISEGKAAVTLNPQKSTNWDSLAAIYRNVINVAEGADVWTVSSYQRAIITDPQNPTYRLNLGGVYYSLNVFDEALKLFEQSVSLKPDWANAHYNLAWAAFQRGDYPRAASEMQTVLTLLDPGRDKADITRAQADLEEFKKKLPQTQTPEEPTAPPNELTLPSPAPTLEPKIELPEEASPEAK